MGSAPASRWQADPLGVSAEDDEQERLRTTTATLIALVVVLLAPTWIVAYLALGRPLSAAIPGTYELISIGSLVWLASGTFQHDGDAGDAKKSPRAIPAFAAPDLQS